MQLDPAIERPPLFCRVVAHRLRLAEAVRCQPVVGDAVEQQIRLDRGGAESRKIEIVLVTPGESVWPWTSTSGSECVLSSFTRTIHQSSAARPDLAEHQNIGIGSPAHPPIRSPDGSRRPDFSRPRIGPEIDPGRASRPQLSSRTLVPPPAAEAHLPHPVPGHPLETDRRPHDGAGQALDSRLILRLHPHPVMDRKPGAPPRQRQLRPLVSEQPDALSRWMTWCRNSSSAERSSTEATGIRSSPAAARISSINVSQAAPTDFF